MTMLRETVKAVTQHQWVFGQGRILWDLCLGKEISHSGLPSEHMMRHRESEWEDGMLSTEASIIAVGTRTVAVTQYIHVREASSKFFLQGY